MSGFNELRRVAAHLTGNTAAFARVAEFLTTVARIEADSTRSAHSRARAIIDQLDASLQELREAGSSPSRSRRSWKHRPTPASASSGS